MTDRQHIQMNHAARQGKAWCGAQIQEWAFQSIDHAALFHAKGAGAFMVCEACREKAIAALSNDEPARLKGYEDL